jgi:hypothetical protein
MERERMKRILALIVICLVASAAVPESAGDGPSSALRPVHEDGEALKQSVLRVTRAFLDEDAAQARKALDELKALSVPLDSLDDEGYGHEILSLDRGFHVTIDRAREFTTAGKMDKGFDQFVWVQRACIQCHGMARDRGLMSQDRLDGGE